MPPLGGSRAGQSQQNQEKPKSDQLLGATISPVVLQISPNFGTKGRNITRMQWWVTRLNFGREGG